jgi:dipeptidyl aminopeptidase/acylaminoacyl peptidase
MLKFLPVPRQPLTAEDLYRFQWIDMVRLQPGGSLVAYQVTVPDEEARDYRTRIYVRGLQESDEPRLVVEPPKRDHSLNWSPDGTSLAFVRKGTGAEQVFSVAVDGRAEPRQLTAMPEGVFAPRWSPDGRWVAFLAKVLGDPDGVVDDPRPPDSEDDNRRAPVARVIRGLDYKHDGSGFTDGRFHHLFVVPARGGEARQLTSGAWSVEEFDWAPDSTRLVVSGDAEPDSDLRREINLYTVDLDANLRRLLAGMYFAAPAWSPRGDFVAFAAPERSEPGLNTHVWVVEPDGRNPRCLTRGFENSVGDGVINDMRAGHFIRLVWGPEGDRVHFVASGPGVTGIFSVDLEGNVSELVGGRRQVFDFDADREHLAFLASDPYGPGDLYVVGGHDERRLTNLNAWLDDREVIYPERLDFKAPDGLRLEGWILKPPGFDASRAYPLVMEVHGGPHGQYGWSFFHEFQMLAGMGFCVFYLNPRGSDGYGEAFKKAVVRDWAGKDYEDLMAALDQLLERGYVDEKRIGVAGGSYGGYMVNWMIGHSDRFAAAIAMRSICNLVSEYCQHDIVPWGVEELGPPPWSDPDELWQRSPIRYVDRVHTPLLLTHGEMDLRCAVSQAEEMFGALRLLGREVEMVRFPGESHDLSRSGRPDRRVERLRRIAEWFSRYLKPGAPPEPATSRVGLRATAPQSI